MEFDDLTAVKDDMVAFIAGHGMRRMKSFVPEDVPTVLFEEDDVRVRNRVCKLVELVIRDSRQTGRLDVGCTAHRTHSTALYLRASSCFTFLNISG